MTQKTKVRRIGTALGIIIPNTLAENMALREGDDLFLVHTPEGLTLTPYDSDFAEALADARAYMHAHRQTFHELAQ